MTKFGSRHVKNAKNIVVKIVLNKLASTVQGASGTKAIEPKVQFIFFSYQNPEVQEAPEVVVEEEEESDIEDSDSDSSPTWSSDDDTDELEYWDAIHNGRDPGHYRPREERREEMRELQRINKL